MLFDLDGTLVASDGVWDQAMVELAAAHGRRLPSTFFAQSVGLSVADAIAIAHEVLQLPAGHFDRDLRWVQDRARALLGAAPPPWFHGARELVRDVRAAGLLTGLVTSSGRAHVEAALTAADRSRFDVIVCGDEVTAPKPNPEPYLRAASLLGVAPAECAVVEDSVAGVASALAAGCRPVVVASAAVPAGSGYPVVETIAQVDLAMLRSLQHGRPTPIQG